MESLRKLHHNSQSHNAYLLVFIIERLCHATSWQEALDIISAGDHQGLADFTRFVIERKRSLSQEENVAEVVTDDVTEVMPGVVTAVAIELATGGEIPFMAPFPIPQNHQELQFLSSVFHDQVCSFVLKYHRLLATSALPWLLTL
jgi:glycerol-3-phosphate responsive antiterminator